MKTRTLSYFFISFIFLLPCVVATDYYVSTSGSNNDPGTSASPWKNINHAVDNINSGDTIFVKSGTYNEYVSISESGTSSNYKRLTNYNDDLVTITRGSYKRVGIDIAGSFWKVDGFHITQTGHPISIGGGRHHVEIRNLEVYDIDAALLVNDGCNNIEIDNCHFCRPYDGGVNFIGLRGEDDDICHHITISDCSFDGCGHNSINLFDKCSDPDYHGLFDLTIDRCTFTDGTQIAIGTNCFAVERMIVRDCVFDNYCRGIQCIMRNCLIENCVITNHKAHFVYCAGGSKNVDVTVRGLKAHAQKHKDNDRCICFQSCTGAEAYNNEISGFFLDANGGVVPIPPNPRPDPTPGPRPTPNPDPTSYPDPTLPLPESTYTSQPINNPIQTPGQNDISIRLQHVLFDILGIGTHDVWDFEWDSLSTSNLKPDKNISSTGNMEAWVDIVGFNKLYKQDNIYYYPGDPLNNTIVDYKVTESLTGSMSRWNDNVDWVHQDLSFTITNNTITVVMNVTMLWHHSVKRKIGKGIKKTYYYDSLTVTDTEYLPDIHVNGSLHDGGHIKICNNSFNPKMWIVLQDDGRIKTDVIYKSERVEYYDNLAMVEYTKKGYPYVNLTGYSTYSLNENKILKRVGSYYCISGNTFDIFNIIVYTRSIYEVHKVKNYSVNYEEYDAKHSFDPGFMLFNGILLVFVGGIIYIKRMFK